MNELANLLSSRSVDKEICKLPHNLEAEQMLIGAMIRDNRICDAVEDTITAENFYDPLHQSIFTQISKTRKHGIVANELSLKMFFENDQAFTECGGVEYLAKLAAKASIALDIYSLTRIIRDTYLRRCLIKLGQEIVGDSYNYDIENPAQAQIEQAMTKLFNLAVKKQGEKTYIKLASSIKDVVEKISTETKNFLDKPRQRPYHETEAIYLSSLYRLNDKKTQRIWRLIFNFLHYVHLMSLSNFRVLTYTS